MSEDKELTVDEVAARLGVVPNTVRRLLQRKELRGYQLARKTGWRVRSSDVQAFIESKMNRQTEQPSSDSTARASQNGQ